MGIKARNVYAIRDGLAEDVGPLFEAPTHAVALRQFSHLLSQVDDSSKGDYKLFCVGFFDADNMTLTAIDAEEVKIAAMEK